MGLPLFDEVQFISDNVAGFFRLMGMSEMAPTILLSGELVDVEIKPRDIFIYGQEPREYLTFAGKTISVSNHIVLNSSTFSRKVSPDIVNGCLSRLSCCIITLMKITRLSYVDMAGLQDSDLLGQDHIRKILPEETAEVEIRNQNTYFGDCMCKEKPSAFRRRIDMTPVYIIGGRLILNACTARKEWPMFKLLEIIKTSKGTWKEGWEMRKKDLQTA